MVEESIGQEPVISLEILHKMIANCDNPNSKVTLCEILLLSESKFGISIEHVAREAIFRELGRLTKGPDRKV